MKNTSSVLIAFVGGALVGAAVALLLAPDSGKETRRKIVNFLDENGLKLEDSDNEADEILVDGEPSANKV